MNNTTALVNNLQKKYSNPAIDELSGEYYGNSDYINYGYWEPETKDQKSASANLVAKLLSYIPEKNGTILDVACGKGATVRHLLQYYPASSITAINILEQQLAVCRQKAPDCQFINMDATVLDFPPETFDNIICVEAAFHFNTREQFLRRASSVLKPGGRLVLSDIIVTRMGEILSPTRLEENYIPNLDAYHALYLRCGFESANILDATEASWNRFHCNYIHFMSKKLLKNTISLNQFHRITSHLKAMNAHLRHYVITTAYKGLAA